MQAMQTLVNLHICPSDNCPSCISRRRSMALEIVSWSISMKIFTLVMLNKLRCPTHFQFSANQITWSRLLIQILIINDKQCRSRSVGFFRSQLIWIYIVCKGRAYPGSAGLVLSGWTGIRTCDQWICSQTCFWLGYRALHRTFCQSRKTGLDWSDAQAD